MMCNLNKIMPSGALRSSHEITRNNGIIPVAAVCDCYKLPVAEISNRHIKPIGRFALLIFLMALFTMNSLFAQSIGEVMAAIETYNYLYDGTFEVSDVGNTITVTGVIKDATTYLTLNIPADVTIDWQASLTGTYSNQNYGLVHLTGTGTFKVTDGLIESTGNLTSAIRNNSSGRVEISGGRIKAGTGSAIYNFSSGVVTISGEAYITNASTASSQGTIFVGSSGAGSHTRLSIEGGIIENTASNTYAYAINNNSIMGVSNGIVRVTGNESRAIYLANNASLTITGGKISSTTGNTIQKVANGTITISGGEINSTTANTIDSTNRGSLTISGGEISSTTGTTIYHNGIDMMSIKISGGLVRATTRHAIFLNGSSVTLSVEGGTVFAHGTQIIGTDAANSVIRGASSGFTGPTGDGVVIAWNASAGTTYNHGDTNNLLSMPAGVASWVAPDGITFANGDNRGTFSVPGATVTITNPVFNPPTALNITEQTTDLVKLVWTLPNSGSSGQLIGFKVYRESESGSEKDFTVTNPTQNYFEDDISDIALENFDYWVTALYKYAHGESEPSETVTAIFESVLPVILSEFGATSVENGVMVHWTAETEASMLGYRIKRAETGTVETGVYITALIPARNNTNTEHYHHIDREVINGREYFYWIEAIENNGSSEVFGPISVVFTLDGDEQPIIITTMSSAYPNPVNVGSVASIDISVKANETAELSVYNIRGQLVRSYENLPAGHQTVIWDGRDTSGREVSSGVYFYRLTSPSSHIVQRMVVIK